MAVLQQKKQHQSTMEESLAVALQKALGGSSEDYTEDTILDSDINQIRHLFYWLHSEARPVFLNYGSENYRCQVETLTDSYAVLRAPGFREEPLRRCRIRFDIVNILYQFELPILDMNGELVTIKVPAFIQSAQRRKHRRIPTDDLFMRFGIVYQPLLGKRGAGQILEQRYPHITKELARDEPDLYLINRIVTEETARIAKDFEIVFYGPEYRKNLMESLVGEEKKTLFLRDVSRLQSYVEQQTLLGLINYHREYALLLRNRTEDEALKAFEAIQHEDMQKFISSYACAPLMIFDEVIGHIHAYSTIFDQRHITYEEAFQIDLMAHALNYAMSKTVIARSYFRHTYTRVMNISLGGLLFELTNRTIFDYLTYHDRIKMLVPVRHTLLEMEGEITRFFPYGEGYNIGVRFYQTAPDDYKELENFIYERSRMTFE